MSRHTHQIEAPFRSSVRSPGSFRPLAAAGLLVGLASAPGIAFADDASTLLPAGATVETLDNGLKVVLLPIDTPGLVAVQTWMRVGSGEETVPGLTGFAHFFEHLMFHGTEEMPGPVREKKLLALSVTENAWTSQDATVYHLMLPAQNLDAVLKIEADRFQALSLEADGVRKEAGAVYGEFRKGRASPDRAVWEATWATAFSSHPYHHTTIGVEADIAAMPEQLDAARRFFTTWYRPENATLVLAGDLEPGKARAIVLRTFGQWAPEAEAPPWPPTPVEPAQTGLKRAQVVWEAGPVNPRLAIAWRTPAHAPGSADAAALSLLPALLSSDVAPLHRKLVDDERRVRWIWAMEPENRHPGLFLMEMELAEGEDPAAVEADVLAAVQALVDDDSPEAVARLDMTRERKRRELLLGLDSAESWAGAFGRASLYGPPVRTLDAEVAAIAAVTRADVVRVVERYLLPDTGRTVVTLVAPDAADPDTPPPPLGPDAPAAAGGAQ